MRMKRLGLVRYLLAAGIGMGCAGTVFTKAPGKMRSVKTDSTVGGRMETDVFGIRSEDYFTNPLKDFTRIGFRLEEEGFNGLAIGGPGYVPIAAGGKFPLAIMNVTESLDASLHLFDDYALVTAMDLSSGNLQVAMAVEQKYVKPKRDPIANPPPPGRSSDGCAVDIFDRLRIRKSVGEYLLTAVLLDRASNRIRVRVGSPEMASDEKMFQEALIMSKATSEKFIPNTTATPVGADVTVPALPEGFGITLFSGEEVKSHKEKRPVPIYGSFKIPIPKRKVNTASNFPDVPGSSVPIILVATGTLHPQPLVFRFIATAMPDHVNQSPHLLAGQFSIDINQLGWIVDGQTYSIHAFSGEYLSAPISMGLQVSR